MVFESGSVATIMMTAHSTKVCDRQTFIHGSLGEIECTDGNTVIHRDFAGNTVRQDEG
jgi:hypothetical protein